MVSLYVYMIFFLKLIYKIYMATKIKMKDLNKVDIILKI